MWKEKLTKGYTGFYYIPNLNKELYYETLDHPMLCAIKHNRFDAIQYMLLEAEEYFKWPPFDSDERWSARLNKYVLYALANGNIPLAIKMFNLPNQQYIWGSDEDVDKLVDYAIEINDKELTKLFLDRYIGYDRTNPSLKQLRQWRKQVDPDIQALINKAISIEEERRLHSSDEYDSDEE